MEKALIILGPTAIGKTSLGISLAEKFSGEIISADSRQVYKGMDIGAGKDLPVNSKLKNQNLRLNIKNNNLTVGFREKEGIPVWLIDVVDPDYQFNLKDFVFLGRKVVTDIWSRKKLPIVVGGTGLYIKALFEPLSFISIPPNNLLRKKLEKETKENLGKLLKKIDPDRWKKMNYADRLNPRRLIRGIEISYSRKEKNQLLQETLPLIDKLIIGLNAPRKMIYRRVDKHVDLRLNQGVIEEIENLLSLGYKFSLTSFSTLGYKQFQEYFDLKNPSQKEKYLKEATQKWKYAEHAYARRQMTWFKKEKNIHWFDISQRGFLAGIESLIEKWYTS